MQQPLGSDPVAERARVSPAQAAIVRAEDGETWTYAELDDAVETTAGRLAAFGVGVEDHVALLADTGLPAVRTIYATLRLGAVPVLLNARLTAAELAPQIERADVTTLVTEPAFEGTAIDAVAGASVDVGLTTVANSDDRTAICDETANSNDERTSSDETTSASTATLQSLAALDPAPFQAADPDGHDLRLLLFTSGTTGEPKAVELTAGNLRSSALASALRLGVEPDDHWFVPLSIYHMGGFAPIFRSILYGTTAIVQREFDADATLRRIDAHDATCLSVVPTMLQRLLDATGDAGADRSADDPMSSLRFVLSGGAATPHDLVERCTTHDVELYPTYGITEAASQVATATPEEAREQPGTVGRPLLPVEVRLVGDGGDSVPRGDRGEIVVDGPTVSPGYYGDDAATAASRSDLGYHTGDLGYRDDGGRLYVLGRADDRIVTGGENVHAAEVEAVLTEHARVDDAVVLGLDDPEWGERVAALVAGDCSPDELRAHCADQLAGYKRPRTVAVVDELPRTASGTVDREAARERLEADGVEV